jgi:hypothetical protein
MSSNGIQMLNSTLGRKCEKGGAVQTLSLGLLKESGFLEHSSEILGKVGIIQEACVVWQPESQLCLHWDSKISEPARRADSVRRTEEHPGTGDQRASIWGKVQLTEHSAVT